MFKKYELASVSPYSKIHKNFAGNFDNVYVKFQGAIVAVFYGIDSWKRAREYVAFKEPVKIKELRKENRGRWYMGHELPERRKVG